jgi:hypothetical protein
MSDIHPGPCPPEGCPPGTEIDCIEVNKVFDFCFNSNTQDVNFPIPSSCGTVPAGSTAEASITSVDCKTHSVTPIANSGGFAHVTIIVTVTVSITITAPDGTTLCTFSGTYSFHETVTLCAPDGVTVTCNSPNGAILLSVIMPDEVRSTVAVCLLIQSMALVKIMVPTYGYCIPSECEVLPFPPFDCPPASLFPPQCVVPPPDVRC